MFDKDTIAFIDDIFIYSNSTNLEHETFFYKVLDCLLEYGLYIVIVK